MTVLDILHKRIISVTVSDARFLPGETLDEIFARTESDYGDGLKIYFANEAGTTNEGDRGRMLMIEVVAPSRWIRFQFSFHASW